MATSEPRAPITKRAIPLSLIGKTVRLVVNLGWLTLIAWMLLLLVAGISKAYWSENGVEYLLRAALLAMNSHAWDINGFPLELSASATWYLPTWFASAFPDAGAWQKTINAAKPAVHLVLLITQFIYCRCCAFFLGRSLLLALACLGLLDGLVQRDIRKYRGTRESSLFFHRSKAFLLFFFYSSYFLFIAIPVAFNWHIAILLIAIILAALIATSSRHFKKYL